MQQIAFELFGNISSLSLVAQANRNRRDILEAKVAREREVCVYVPLQYSCMHMQALCVHMYMQALYVHVCIDDHF